MLSIFSCARAGYACVRPILEIPMRTNRQIFFLLIIAILGEGCQDRQAWKESFKSQIPEEDDRFARHYIDLIRNRQYEAAIEKLDPQMRTADIHEKLDQIRVFLDRGEPISIEPVSFNKSQDNAQINLQYQIDYRNFRVLATIIVQRRSDGQWIYSSIFNPLHDSIERLNSFSLSNKGLKHYVFIIPMMVGFLFITYTVVLCLRTKEIRHKWIWLILILVVVGKCNLNWTTGDYSFQAFNIKIGIPPGFSVSKTGSPYAPWILSFSFPIGAVFFLLAHKRLQTNIVKADEFPHADGLQKDEILPEEIQCPDCGAELKLDEIARTEKRFTCSVCNESFVIKD